MTRAVRPFMASQECIINQTGPTGTGALRSSPLAQHRCFGNRRSFESAKSSTRLSPPDPSDAYRA